MLERVPSAPALSIPALQAEAFRAIKVNNPHNDSIDSYKGSAEISS
jgi:hypothetical protein